MKLYYCEKQSKTGRLSPSMSVLRTLSKVCEEYATEFDVIFNDKNLNCCFSGVENVYFTF